MSSLAGKMSLLVDSYNHSKSSPAYRELRIKYKTLKATNQELLHLLNVVFSGMNSSLANPPRTKLSRKIRRNKSDGVDTNVDTNVDKELYNYVDECSANEQEQEDQQEEEQEDQQQEDQEEEQQQESDNTVIDEYREEPDDDDDCEQSECDDGLELDIKNQIIAEDEAEEFAISHELVNEEEEEVEEEVVEEEEEEEVEVEEEEVVEEVVEEEEEVVEEEVEDVVEEEEEEEGVYEIELNGKRYYTTSEQNGIVYEVIDDDDVGDEIGKFVNGKLVLN
jgi:hypothetical protein